MVKNVRKIILIVFAILILCGFSSYKEGDLAKNDLAVLEKINTEVSKLFTVDGAGIPTTEGYEKVIASKEANCTQYAYVFARRAYTSGYEVKVLGITTTRNTNHAVVNVKVGERWFLFDPTNGVYYKADAFDIFQNPDLVKKMVGVPTKKTKVYTNKSFFQQIGRITVAQNLDYAEQDLSSEAQIIEESKFYKTPNGVGASIHTSTDKDYTAALPGSFPNYFVLKWDEPHDFYRVSIQWVDELNYASDFKIMALVGGEYVTIAEESEYATDNINFVQLLKPVTTDQIKFVVTKTNGQDRLLLRRFSLYE